MHSVRYVCYAAWYQNSNVKKLISLVKKNTEKKVQELQIARDFWNKRMWIHFTLSAPAGDRKVVGGNHSSFKKLLAENIVCI